MDTGVRPHGLEHAAAVPEGQGQGQGQRSGPLSSESQLSATSGLQAGAGVHQEGFDFEFVPPLDPQYECPICTLILRNPTQTRCGHRFCQVCIKKWIRYGFVVVSLNISNMWAV